MAGYEFIKEKTVCFTGHRPEKLPEGGADHARITKVLKSLIYKEVIDSINEGYDCFITGLARGIDLWAGEIVMSEIAAGRNIKLVAAAPYRSHGANFMGYDRWLLGNIMLKADHIEYVSENYHKFCMKHRNEFMVNNSSRLIAVVSDWKSGTGQTIRMAQKQGLDTRIINALEMAEITANTEFAADYIHY